MRFKSRDLMIDVLPVQRRVPGLALCGQATAGGREGGDDEELDECGQATAGQDAFTLAGGGLSLLRQQLHDTLGQAARP